MNLMLVFIVAVVGIGLVVPRVGRRHQVVVALLAVVVTALYFVYPQRFM